MCQAGRTPLNPSPKLECKNDVAGWWAGRGGLWGSSQDRKGQTRGRRGEEGGGKTYLCKEIFPSCVQMPGGQVKLTK